MIEQLTEQESRFAQLLRDRVEHEIDRRGREDAARALGVTPAGVDALLWKVEWHPAKALRVAALLDVLTLAEVNSLLSRESAA